MSIANAFFVTLAFAGAGYLAYLIGSFLAFHAHHRSIRRNRRWPREGHHRSYFRPLKNWPEE